MTLKFVMVFIEIYEISVNLDLNQIKFKSKKNQVQIYNFFDEFN